MDFSQVKISTTVSKDAADAVRQALGQAGAGVFGDYTFCSFSVTGTGRFIPSSAADPHVGEPNTLNEVAEEQIQVICQRSKAKQVIAALKQAHPYEEPIIEIVPLLSAEQV